MSTKFSRYQVSRTRYKKITKCKKRASKRVMQILVDGTTATVAVATGIDGGNDNRATVAMWVGDRVSKKRQQAASPLQSRKGALFCAISPCSWSILLLFCSVIAFARLRVYFLAFLIPLVLHILKSNCICACLSVVRPPAGSGTTSIHHPSVVYGMCTLAKWQYTRVLCFTSNLYHY